VKIHVTEEVFYNSSHYLLNEQRVFWQKTKQSYENLEAFITAINTEFTVEIT